jgi:hypothetical protein
MWKPKYQVLTILLMLAFILAACGGGSSAMSPEELIAASATHMNDLAGFEFGLKYDGEPVIMDADGLTKFTSATGQFNAPDQVSATVKASAASMVVEIKMIGTNGQQWITNPLTGSWVEVTGQFALEPAKILNGETGLFASIAEGLAEIILVGEEELEEAPGLMLNHLEGTMTGEPIHDLSGGMIDPGTLDIGLWIDAETLDVHRVQVEDATGGTWQLDMWNFGSTFDIQPPL